MTFGFSFGSGGGSGSSAFPTTPTILVNGKKRNSATVGDALTVFYPPVGLTAPTQQALRDGTSISGATGYLYTIVTADAGAAEITFTGTDLAGVAYTTAGVQLAANLIINSAIFTAGGAGTSPSIALDYEYNRDLDLTLTLDFRDGGGVVLDTLTVTPLVAGPITIEDLDTAAEGATDILVTLTDGNMTDTTVTAVSGLDATAPYVSAFLPDSGTVDVPESGNLVVSFSEPIFKGTGSITIAAGVVVPIAACTVTGADLTIPYTGLPYLTDIAPTWPSGFVVDAQGNPAGPLVNEWSFKTVVDPSALAVTSLAGESLAVLVGPSHTLNFDSTGYAKVLVAAGISQQATSMTIEGVSVPLVIASGNTSGANVASYFKTLTDQGPESATVTWANDVNYLTFGAVGINNGVIDNSAAAVINGNSQTISVTPASATNKIVLFAHGNTTGTLVPPNNMTEVYRIVGNSAVAALYMATNVPAGVPFTITASKASGRTGLNLHAISQV